MTIRLLISINLRTQYLRLKNKYKNHPKFRVIKENSNDNHLTFDSISKSDIKKEILNLDSTKAIQDSD